MGMQKVGRLRPLTVARLIAEAQLKLDNEHLYSYYVILSC